MKDITCVILAAGSSLRFNKGFNKVYVKLNNKPIIEHSIDKFLKFKEIKKIIIVYNHQDLHLLNSILEAYDDERITIIEGGSTRQESLQQVKDLVDTNFLMIHDAARPYTSIKDIETLIDNIDKYEVLTLAKHPVDAVKVDGKHIRKKDVYLTSTPQCFNRKSYIYLFDNNCDREDDLEPFEENNNIHYVLETSNNLKITYSEDLLGIDLVGYSMDFHLLEESNKPFKLGGLTIESKYSLKGHSDADVVLHAVTEAILGALHLKDLGDNYPDNNLKYKDYDSKLFLMDAKEKMENLQYAIKNIDIMIFLEQPKLKDYKPLIEKSISNILNIDEKIVSVKATTAEKEGVIGSNKGVAASAIVLLSKR